MQILPLPTFSVRDLVAANADSAARTPGLHVTDIIAVIMAAVDPAKARRNQTAFTQTELENYQELGFLWEDLLSKVFARRAADRSEDGAVRWRPGEVTKDGIIGSPDGVVAYTTGAIVGEEYKCTWKSSKEFDLYDKRYLKWLIQMQAYCHLLDLRTYDLHVLHLNGDWTDYVPQVRSYRLTFGDAEIADQWTSLKNTAQRQGWL